MKKLADFEIDGRSFSLAQAEWAGEVESPRSASLLRPMSRLEGDCLVGNLLRLHTDEPELVILTHLKGTGDLHDEELQSKILIEGARIWREHYDPTDFADEIEPAGTDEPDYEFGPRHKWSLFRDGSGVVGWVVMLVPGLVFIVSACAGFGQFLSVPWSFLVGSSAGTILTFVYWATVVPTIGRAWGRACIRSVLRDLVEHRREVTEVQEELAELDDAALAETRAQVVLTRAHINAMLTQYERDLGYEEDPRASEAELRAWARTIEDLHGTGIPASGPVRYEDGHANAIAVVMSSLVNEKDPWFPLTEYGIAGMRRFLDIADSVPDPDDVEFDAAKRDDFNRILDLKSAGRFHCFAAARTPFYLCVYAHPTEPKFGLISLCFKGVSRESEDLEIAEFTVDESGTVASLELLTEDSRMPERRVRKWLESVQEQLAAMAAVQRP